KKALHLCEETLALHRNRGDISGMATDLTNLSMTTLRLGLLDRARTYLTESIELGDRLERKGHRIAELFCAAGLATSRSEWQRAAHFLGAMQAICESIDYHFEPADRPFVASVVDATRGALGADAFETAVARGRALQIDEVMTDVRTWLREIRSQATVLPPQ